MISVRIRLLAAGTAIAFAVPASAQDIRPSLQNSFRLGTGGDTLCQVQSSIVDPAIAGMFDRAYSIVCRDAVQPIGRVYALRKDRGDPAERLATLRRDQAVCEGGPQPAAIEGLSATALQCRLGEADVGYRVYTHESGRTLYVAEGLAGYDSALALGLRTIVADRILPGDLVIASTQAGNAAAFARVQAGTLDLDQARDEGYRRNNSGNYAEAAEFFETLLERSLAEGSDKANIGEYLINRALQRSNLGSFAEADTLFAQADTMPTADPVQLRLRRNYRALHLLNQRKLDEAAVLLATPLAPVASRAGGTAPVIDRTASTLINSASPLAQQLSGGQPGTLAPEERAAILDAQAVQLQGTIHRLQGRPDEAARAFADAQATLLGIRGGRVTSIARLRSQSLGEQALLAETRGDQGEAERLFRESIDVLSIEYPQSVAVAAANARLGAYYARRGRTDESIAIYRDITARAGEGALAGNVSADMLAPYFALLTREIPRRPELLADFFLAGETLVRPGVASTQAVLARELSAGNDEAARLFRQAVTLTREAEQTRVNLSRLRASDNAGPAEREQVAALTAELATLEASQAATQARLADFPRFRALSTEALTLDDLRAALQPGEAYLKMNQVGGAIYVMLVTPDTTRAYRSRLSARQVDAMVDTLRDSISVVDGDQMLTYPFDIATARRLHAGLFEPVSGDLAGVQHIIFEPAGSMLKLPLNLLVEDDASVQRYAQQMVRDEFDFRGVNWVGRRHDVSTAVSARAFRDVRQVAPSSAALEYLGLGQNSPVSGMAQLAGLSSGVRGPGALGSDCSWPLAGWNNPISASELRTAQGVIGFDEARIVTGDDFTDVAIQRRDDLDQYRILHFATHGLVTPPRPDCPAEPALLTSFATDPAGAPQSDGLLTFRDIFDLRLDADLVILSACDTAAAASSAVTREAGLAGGGDYALDGLVRAFVGAGGRSVVASHWPAPDDYGATEQLISGLFTAQPGTSVVSAMRTAQLGLMDKLDTSHPYYWAGFAIIGDGTRPVLRSR